MPTPPSPVPIVSAGDGGTVTVTVSDGANESQTLTLQTPNALPGIPVTSGGNYTDENGQQWVCDEVDLARGVRVQRITKFKLTSSMSWTKAGNNVDRYFCTFARINTAGVLCTHFSAAINGETVGGIATSNGTTIGFAYAEKARRPSMTSRRSSMRMRYISMYRLQHPSKPLFPPLKSARTKR